MSLLNKASLIQIPSGYKDGTLYSAKPTNGDGDFTFSRGSNLAATRVNSEGLIEKGRENLLLQSNTFDTTWSGSVTTTSGQSGYDGSSDAWLVENTAASAYIRQDNTTSGVLTASIYAKSGNVNYMRFAVSNSPIVSIYFDLVNGVGYGASNIISHDIEDVGNGWHRYSVSFLASSMSGMQWYPADANNDLGEGGDNIIIQDAQLEVGLVATDYIETTTTTEQAGILEDMPRLDYSGGATCGHLLLEPQRTNLVTQSEYYGDSSWDKVSSGTGSNAIVTDNYGISPEGLQNASRLQLNLNGGTTASDISYIAYYYTATGVATTNSIYIKSLSGTSNVRIRSGSTFKSIDVTTEWQRFDVTDLSSSDRFQLLIFGGINSDTADLLIYGVMAEAGSYPTSYIPTYGASVTRGADDCEITSATALIGQTEGAIFFEYTPADVSVSTAQDTIPLALSIGGSSANAIFLNDYNGNLNLNVNVGGVGQAQIQFGSLIAGQTFKIGIGYASNDLVYYVNGTQIGTDTSLTVPACDEFKINGFTSTVHINNVGVKQALLFKTRLTNDELADLTTI